MDENVSIVELCQKACGNIQCSEDPYCPLLDPKSKFYQPSRKMRFSLRNQDKIKKSLGETYLVLLLSSLKIHFSENDNIKEEMIEGGKHNAIFVHSVAKNSEIDFQFIIISKKFDVYNLAYYSSIG
jgi:hypothetical protein